MNPVEKKIISKNNISIIFINIAVLYKEISNLELLSNYQIAKPDVFDEDNYKLNWLNDCEIEKINSFSTFKKQIEWLSGRFALKSGIVIHQHALESYLFEELTGYFGEMKKNIVEYGEKGAPYVKNSPNVNISLSHSGNYSACIIDFTGRNNVAIDIEKIEDKNIETIMKVAFTEREQSLVRNSPNPEKEFYKIWTGKESYLKILKKGFHEPLKNIEIIDNLVIEKKNDTKISVKFEEYNAHYFSYIIK